MIRLLVVIAVVLVGGYTAADLYARTYTDHQLEQRIRAAVPEAQRVTVKISSFPFLARLLGSGDVRQVSAEAAPVTDGRVTFERISVNLSDVRLDRTQLLRYHRVRLTGITGGQATAVLTQAELSDSLGGVPIKLTPGHLTITVRGVTVTATVSLVNNQLRLQPQGLPLVSLAIPTNGLLPCSASVVIEQAQLSLGCAVNRVPPALLGAGTVQLTPSLSP